MNRGATDYNDYLTKRDFDWFVIVADLASGN